MRRPPSTSRSPKGRGPTRNARPVLCAGPGGPWTAGSRGRKGELRPRVPATPRGASLREPGRGPPRGSPSRGPRPGRRRRRGPGFRGPRRGRAGDGPARGAKNAAASRPERRARVSRGPSGFTRRRKPFAKLPVSTTSPDTGEATRTRALPAFRRKAGPFSARRSPTAGRTRASGVPTRRVARSSRPRVTVPSSFGLQPGVAAVVEAVGQDEEAAGVDRTGAASRPPRGGRASRTPCSRRRARSDGRGALRSGRGGSCAPRRAAPRTPRARGSRRPGRGRRRAGPRRSPRRASRRRPRGRARRRPGRSRWPGRG